MITGYAKSFLDYRMKLFRESRGHKIHRTQRSKTIFQINEKITQSVTFKVPVRTAQDSNPFILARTDNFPVRWRKT